MNHRAIEIAPTETPFVPLDFDKHDLTPAEQESPTFIDPHTGRRYPLAIEALALGESLDLFRAAPIAGETPAKTAPLPLVETPQKPDTPTVYRRVQSLFEAIGSAHTARNWKLLGASALLAISGGALTAAWHHRAPQRESYEQPDMAPAKDQPEKES